MENEERHHVSIQMPDTTQETIVAVAINSQLGSSKPSLSSSSDHETTLSRRRSSVPPSSTSTDPNDVPSLTESKTPRKSFSATRSPSGLSSKTRKSRLLQYIMSKLHVFIESLVFLCITCFLIASLKANKLKDSTIWELKLWKWCLLMLATICGRLIAALFVNILICLIWKLFLEAKVLYFVYGVKKSFQVFIWIGLVFLTWGLAFDRHGGGVERTEDTKKVIRYVTKALAGCLVGSAIWLLKTLLVKLVGSIHAAKLFMKIEEAICNRQILLALSSSKKEEVQKVDEKRKVVLEELIGGIRVKKLFSLCYFGDEEGKTVAKEISDEDGARKAGDEIFKSLSLPDDKQGYIKMETLKRYVDDKKVIQHFEEIEEENGIKRSVFRKWVVKVYNDHSSLNMTLKYSKSAMDELNMVASGVVLVVDIVVLLLLMGLLTTKLLVFISSQLLLVVFMFGNTAKTMFEAIIFVFLMHPFDIGDRCVIDGVQMVVEEMSILSTIFLRYDGEKIYYPNSVLSVKPISNLYRSPPMSDSLKFAIDVFTPMETIEKLQEEIKEYLESNRRHWRPDHSVQFREIENVNKMKMVIFVNHTINFHYVDKRMSRRSEFVLQMKRIFEKLKIKYQLLPQQVCLNNVQPMVSPYPPPMQ